MQGAVGVDCETRHATVEHRDRAVLEVLAGASLVDGDLGVGEILDQRGDAGLRDDQHGQGAHAAQVGARHPDVPEPRPGPTVRSPSSELDGEAERPRG